MSGAQPAMRDFRDGRICGECELPQSEGRHYRPCPDGPLVGTNGCANPDVHHPFRLRRDEEHSNGSRWAEALRGAGEMRRRAYGRHGVFHDGDYGTGAYLNERYVGIPEMWRR